MDIKLKGKKSKLSLIVFLLSACIALAICSWITLRTAQIDIERSAVNMDEYFESVYQDVNNLMVYTDGFNGGLRKDSIDYEVNRLKNDGGIYDGEKRKEVSDKELKQYVINNFNSYVHDVLVNINLRKNIEFYFDIDEGRNSFTNVDGISKDDFEKDTLDNYKKYIIIRADGKLETSEGMKQLADHLEYSFDKNYNGDVILRLAQPLKEGDLVYERIMLDKKNVSMKYTSIVIFIFSCIGILYSAIKLKKNNLKFDIERGLLKLLGKIDIEAKLLALGLSYIYKMKIKRGGIEYSMFENLISVIVLLLIIFFVVLDFYRIKSVYSGFKLRTIISRESLINKLRVILVRAGMVLNLLFILANITVWYVSLFIFVVLARDLSWGLCYSPADAIFATFATMLFDEVIIRKLNPINDIVKGIKEISKGNYNFNVDIKGAKIFRDVAKDLDNIQSGLKESVDKAVKSERMKSELITNVSHDLKTPLTSIINYVDLLNQKNITEEQRKKYLGILKDKSNRLKALIEDLFEVSKASSGSMKLDMQDLDPVALLRQTLGEFEDKIESSNLKIIKKFPEEKLVIYADGRKTFRVFQNLLSNIFKYSMERSRVYIEVSDAEQYVEVVFKNTSKEELDFTEEEILQRFKRGDISRTTEGSGLGLAIAKSLTEVQQGIFNLKLDGDLFKVTVKLNKVK